MSYKKITPNQCDPAYSDGRGDKITQDGNYVTMIVADQGPEILETFYGYIK